MREALRPTERRRIYDLVAGAGLDVTAWADYQRPESPSTNPAFCYEWAFVQESRIVLCIWHRAMQEQGDVVWQDLNYRTASLRHRDWSANQKKRAQAMDAAIYKAWKRKLSVRVVIVDGPPPPREGEVERRMLDAESWQVAAYDEDSGDCRIQRDAPHAPPESFTPEEIRAAATYAEGALGEAATKTRERSALLRDLARDYFARQSKDSRLHCCGCDWAPPLALVLTGPIVEIHHALGISGYPKDGRALTFEEAIQHLMPLCPNCHRIAHAKPGGGTFTLDEVKRGVRNSVIHTTV